MHPPPRSRRLHFGPFVLDTRRVELRRDGVVVPLPPKPFALLATLASNPGTVLRREDLFAAVWPGAVVSDDSLTQAVREVRVALGDAGAPLLRTVARHGYRFDAEVVDADEPPARPATTPQGAGAAADEHRPSRPAGGAAAAGEPAVPDSTAPAPPEYAAPAGPSQAPKPPWWGLAGVAGRPASMLRWVGALALAGAAVVAGVLRVDDFARALPDRLGSAIGGPTAEPARAAAPRLSLVVLPLDVEAGSESGDWFSDPLTTDLTMDLGKVSGMFVISRETAFAYKGRQVDPRAVARELNVRYVVRGTVGRKGNAVRLDMALIDGETGRQRWAERFDLDRADLQRSLREVTGVLSRSLGVELHRAEGQRAATLEPRQVQADDLAMQGWAVWFRGLSPENTFEALRLFEEAVARDPDSLRAWSGIGLMNAQAANHGWLPDPAPARARQRDALHQMERIDGEDMLTYFARVDPYYRRQDFAGLLQLAQTLVERFPNHPWSHHQHAAALMHLGRFDECVAPVHRALRLGPRDTLRPVVRGMAALCHFAAGGYPESVAEARQMMQESPTQAGPQLMLAAALVHAGRLEDAQAIVRENQGRPMFAQQSLRQVLPGTHPRLVEAREQLLGALKKLGVP